MSIKTLYVESQVSDDSKVLEHLTSNAQYIVDRAYSLSEAKALLNTSAYQVILSNLNLSDSSGIVTVSELKNLCIDCVLIALSDDYKSLEERTFECIEAGAQDLLSLKSTSSFYLHKVIAFNLEFKQRQLELDSANYKVELNNKRISLLNDIYSYTSKSEQNLLDFSLNKAIELTQSEFGYIYFYNEESRLFTLNSWSNGVMKDCEVVEPQTCYELDKTGYWGEAVRQRKALILNDFHAHHPLKKGYPEGHVPLSRFMTTPIFDKEKIIAVVGMANKVDEYNQEDIDQLQLMLNSVWHMVSRNKSEAKNQELFAAMQHSPVSIVITDPRGNIELANNYFEKVTGYTFDEVKGRNPRILKSGAQSQEFYKHLWDTISSGKTWTGELQNRKKTGEFYWESATISPVLNPNGVITKYVAVKKDITQEKLQTEETIRSERLLDATQSIAKSGGWEFDMKTRQMYWTKALYEIHGIDPNKKDIDHAELSLQCYTAEDRERINTLFENCIETGESYDINVPFTSYDGEKKWIRTKTSALLDFKGNVTRILGTVTDITEEIEIRQQIQEIGKENEATKKLFGSVLSHTNHGLVLTDNLGNFAYTNKGLSGLLGYSEEEFRSLNVKDIQSEEGFKKRAQYIDEIKKGKRDGYQIEQPFIRRDGSTFWGNVDVTSMRDENGKLLHLVGALVDISERKESEEKLKASEERLKASEALKSSVIEALSEGLVVQDQNDQIILANDAASHILGVSHDQLMGKTSFDPLWQSFDESRRPLAPENHPSMVTLRTGKAVDDFIMNVHTGNDERRIIKINSRAITDENGKVKQAVTTFQDITQEKISAEIIQKSQEQLDYALKATQAGTWDWNLETSELIINDRWAEMLGYTPAELAPTVIDTWARLVHPEDIDKANELLQNHIEAKLDYYDCKVRMQHKNGSWVWVWTRGQVAERNENGKAIRVVGTHIDVTDWKSAEITVLENAEKFRLIYQSSGMGIGYYDIEGNIIDFNEQALSLINKSLDEVVGKNITELFSNGTGKEYLNRLKMTIEKDEVQTFVDQVKSIENTWFESIYSSVKNERGEIIGALVISSDVSEKIISDQKLKQSAAITQLLANYATELIHFTDKKSIYKYIASETEAIVGHGTITIVSEINDKKTEFEIKATSGLSKLSKTVLKMVGANLVGMKGAVSPKMIELLSDKDAADLPLDIALIADSDFEKRINNSLLKLIGVRSIKAIKLRDDESDIATVSIVSTEKNLDVDLELLRAFLNQATLAISRANSIDSIVTNEKALREAQTIAKLGSWKYSVEDDQYEFSKEAQRILGISENATISQADLVKIVHPEDRQLMYDEHQKMLKSKKNIELEHRIICNNQIVWVNAISKPSFNKKGDLIKAEGTILDITDRKEAELQIAKNEVRFKNLIENNADVIAVENKDFQVTYVSPSIEQMLGYTHEDVMQTSGRLYVHPDDRAYRDEQVKLLAKGDKNIIQLKQRLRKKDRSYIWTLVTFSNQLHVPGIEGFVLNIKDIDQDERNARELAESHQRFALAAAATSDIIWDYDLIENQITGSEAFKKVFGYNITKMAGTEWDQFAHKDDIEMVRSSLQMTIDDPKANVWKHEYRFKRANGEYAWVMNNATVLRDQKGVAFRLIGALSDVTERKAYEKSIEIQNEKLKDIAWMQSHLVRAPLANLLSLVNLLKNEPANGKKQLEDMIYKSASELDSVIRNIVKNAERLENIENSGIQPSSVIIKEGIEHVYLHPSLLDMSTRAYTICNKETKVVYANKAFETLSGYEFEELQLLQQFDFLFSSEKNKLELKTIQAKQEKREPYDSEFLLDAKSGMPTWVRLNAQPFISKEGVYSGYLFMLKDISNEKLAEQTILEKSEILAHINDELKHFTYTISHDLKEPINTLRGLINLLKDSADSHFSEEEKEYIALAEQSTLRVNAMIKALLEYSRSGTESEKTSSISVEETIKGVQSALKLQIEKNKAQINFHGPDKTIKAHPVQFSRILQNLVNNSIKFKSEKNPIIDISLSEDDLHWMLNVKDNGRGIAPEDLKHVFDLFYFKSSMISDSHGIGLAVVKRLIEQHEGTIEVKSKLGQGTTFFITISKFMS